MAPIHSTLGALLTRGKKRRRFCHKWTSSEPSNYALGLLISHEASTIPYRQNVEKIRGPIVNFYSTIVPCPCFLVPVFCLGCLNHRSEVSEWSFPNGLICCTIVPVRFAVASAILCPRTLWCLTKKAHTYRKGSQYTETTSGRHGSGAISSLSQKFSFSVVSIAYKEYWVC